MLPHPHKYLLSDIFSVGRPSEYLCSSADDAVLMPSYKRFKCLKVATLRPKHESNVTCLVALREAGLWLWLILR